MILAEARSLIAKRVRRGTILASPRAARDYLAPRYGHLEHEVFTVLFLGTRRRSCWPKLWQSFGLEQSRRLLINLLHKRSQ